MPKIFIQKFYEESPKELPMVGTKDSPIYMIGEVDFVFEELQYKIFQPETLVFWKGKNVNIYIEDFKYLRNINFSKIIKLQKGE